MSRDCFPLRSLRLLCTTLTGVWLLSAASGARADLIFFKDGFVLQGKVQQEGTGVVDNGQLIWMGRDLFFVDDNARRIFFSRLHVLPGGIEKSDPPTGGEFEAPRDIIFPKGRSLPPIHEIVEVGSWDSKWNRIFKFRTYDGKGSREITVEQHLRMLTPHYARIDALSTPTSVWPWSAYYLTRELDHEVVRTLLDKFPELKVNKDQDSEVVAARRFRYYQFFVHAGWHAEAEAELDRIKDIPGQKERVEAARENLRKLRALQLFDQIKLAQASGQYKWVQKHLVGFPEKGMDDNLLTRIYSLQKEYEAATEKLKLTRRYLSELPEAVSDPAQRRLLTEAAKAISEEVTIENFLPSVLQKEREQNRGDRLDRLETFLVLAEQAERHSKAGRKLEQGQAPEELLALAVSGWVLGNRSTETNVEVALRLWRTRQFVLAYWNTPKQLDRQKLLTDYLAQRSETLSPDEMTQMIAFLPPPEPEEKIGERPVELLTKQRNLPYLLQLPPEYHHGRPYPVLLVLHQAGERMKDILDRWSEHAARYGFILVAPEWQQGLRGSYNYSDREHAVVLDVLHDLRRRFQVDSDRVFLAGHGEGGTMAYDVGLAHPDLFAGVLPMSGLPQYFTRSCRQNAQYLPFYIVGGSHAGKPREENLAHVKEWIQSGYPVMYVEYKGRGLEWFGAEPSFALEWMNRKKRARPITDLGRNSGSGTLGDEFKTMRALDNHFYWLSADEIHPRQINEAANWKPGTLPAKLDARNVDNLISINSAGVTKLSVWLARDMGIDFDKPVVINVKTTQYHNKKVTPNLETLLDDLYQRGDRQRLYVARVKIDIK